ncbi:MAG: hypothetical protein ACOH2A_02105 [Sphingobacteriaceae bacterium]
METNKITLKLLFCLLILGTTVNLKAQNTKNYDYDRKMAYCIGYAGQGGQDQLVFIKPDSGTRKIYPANFLNGLAVTNTNVVYLENATEITLLSYLKPQFLSNYRYRILLNDTTEIVHWTTPRIDTANLPKEAIKQIYDGDVFGNIILAKLNCVDKVITVEMYNVNKPNDVSKAIIINKTIQKPFIWSSAASLIQDGGSTKYRTIYFDERDRENSIPIDSISDVQITMAENDARIIYQVFVKNISQKGSMAVKVPTNWLHKYFEAYAGKEGCYAIIPSHYFSQTGTYEITVMPQLSGGALQNLFKDKATTVKFTVVPQKKNSLR